MKQDLQPLGGETKFKDADRPGMPGEASGVDKAAEAAALDVLRFAKNLVQLADEALSDVRKNGGQGTEPKFKAAAEVIKNAQAKLMQI